MSELVERARFLAAGQGDPHSATITDLCDRIEQLERELAEAREALKGIAKHWPDSAAAKTARAAIRTGEAEQ